MADPQLERVVEQLRRHASDDAAHWLEGALAETRQRFDRMRFLAAYAGAARRMGMGAALGEGEQIAPGAPAPVAIAEMARGALLRTALAVLPESDHEELVGELYRRGDNPERAAVLRTLAHLPAPQRFLATAVDACRSHVQSVFEAIACENPYPARHFPDAAFQQLVLKALFTSVSLARIAGLDVRSTPELVRMACDYASERRAAGREISNDLERLTGRALATSTGER